MQLKIYHRFLTRKNIIIILGLLLLLFAFISSIINVNNISYKIEPKSVLEKENIDSTLISIMVNWNYLPDLLIYNEYSLSEKYFDSEESNNARKIIVRRPFFRKPEIDNLIDNYGEIIIEECNQYKLDWRLILSIIHQESYFDSTARSRAGAFGLMQIMPRTGAGLQSQLQLEDTKTVKNNLIAGIYYFANLVASFDAFGKDKYQFALASYNAGLSRVVDIITIANYFNKDYKIWDTVKQYFPYLSSENDSIQKLVWPSTSKPSGGILNNWREPYNYVENIMYYFEEYKKLLPGNLVNEPRKRRK